MLFCWMFGSVVDTVWTQFRKDREMTDSVQEEELPKHYEPPTVVAFDEVLGLTGGMDPKLSNLGCYGGRGFINMFCRTGRSPW